jgi:hypothetical protein
LGIHVSYAGYPGAAAVFQVHLTLPELPPGTRAMLLSMSNFGGGGFKNIKSLQVRWTLSDGT